MIRAGSLNRQRSGGGTFGTGKRRDGPDDDSIPPCAVCEAEQNRSMEGTRKMKKLQDLKRKTAVVIIK